jgi:hypothetical protein
LKKQLVVSVRLNHKLDRDVAKLDKRIALLIKNRTSLQEVMMQSKGRKRQVVNALEQLEGKRLEHYQDLFYILQTEPIYLANCIYVVNPAQLESFLETVILTLFGDAFSPREEYLVLSLFQVCLIPLPLAYLSYCHSLALALLLFPLSISPCVCVCVSWCACVHRWRSLEKWPLSRSLMTSFRVNLKLYCHE